MRLVSHLMRGISETMRGIAAMNARIPDSLKILRSTEVTKDGRPKDSGGRVIPIPPPFREGTPEAPDHLDDDGLAYWNAVVPELAAAGLLRLVDQGAIGELCACYSLVRGAERRRRAATNQDDELKWWRQEIAAHQELRHRQVEMGLTPSAEGKIGRPAVADNPFNSGWPTGASPTGLGDDQE